MFRRRLFDSAHGHVKFEDIFLTLYPRTVIGDASTVSLPRKEGRDPKAIKQITDWKIEKGRKIKHFLQPYERFI
jgi:hypothetical protein